MTQPTVTILKGEYGSVAQGTAGPDSDHDYMAVILEPAEALLGLGKEESKRVSDAANGEKSAPGSQDTTFHGLRKFAQLAAGGNPTIGSILWLPRYDEISEAGEHLLSIREAFSSKKAGYAYLGYMDSQIKAFAETGRKNRVELVEKYGYDIKFGYHAYRLGVQGFTFMVDHRPMLPLLDAALQYANAIRAGEVEKDDLLETLTIVRNNLAEAIDKTWLPDYPDKSKINEALEEIYLAYWEYGHY